MSYYFKLFQIYKRASTWQNFLATISHGPDKWILLQALEEGYRARIYSDLHELYQTPSKELEVLLDRYDCLVKAKPTYISVQELITQLGETISAANKLRGYFRYAYYVACDDPDTIFAILDEHLTELGAGTPTRDTCARSYTAVTGKHIKPDAVVLGGDTADRVAHFLAAEAEDVQKRLSQLLETGNPEKAIILIVELENLNALHIELTGKSILDPENLKNKKQQLQGKTSKG